MICSLHYWEQDYVHVKLLYTGYITVVANSYIARRFNILQTFLRDDLFHVLARVGRVGRCMYIPDYCCGVCGCEGVCMCV